MLKIILLLVFFNTQILFAKAPLSNSNIDRLEWEVRTAPVAFFAKWLTLDFSYLPNSNWAFGPSLIRYGSEETLGGMLAPTYNGWAYGAHIILAHSLTENSPYISSHAYLENYTSYPHAFSGQKDKSGSKINLDVGYRLVWSNQYLSNLTMMFGIGIEKSNHSVEEKPTNGVQSAYNEYSSVIHFEFKAGYMF